MKTARSQRWLLAGVPLVGILFFASPLVSSRLDVNDYEGGASRDVRARAERNSSSFAVMIGEFRTSMSDILFIKTERYLHGGVAYMPHMSNRLMSVSAETSQMDHHQMEAMGEGHEHEEDDHTGTPTVIRTATEDYRGFIGSLHRQVKPWLDPGDPHIHADGTELLPWYRIMTLTDPRNARAYSIGSWWLKASDLDQAIAFAEEGIANNPRAFQIHNIHGRLILDRARLIRNEGGRDEEFRALVNQSIESFSRAARLGIDRRPADYDPDGPDLPRWGNYDEDDLRNAMRMNVALVAEHKDTAEALALAQEYYAAIGGDPILRRRLVRAAAGLGN